MEEQLSVANKEADLSLLPLKPLSMSQLYLKEQKKPGAD